MKLTNGDKNGVVDGGSEEMKECDKGARYNYLMVGWSRTRCKLDRDREEIHQGELKQ